MARFEVKGPDGARYEVNAPDGASEQDAIEARDRPVGGHQACAFGDGDQGADVVE